jgi:hypothetical protein
VSLRTFVPKTSQVIYVFNMPPLPSLGVIFVAWIKQWNAIDAVRALIYHSHAPSIITVRHLIQEGAVFNQIFALKYDSLLNFLQQTYTGFVYASDEDFEGRTHTMEKLRETEPPSTSAGIPTPVGETPPPPTSAGRPKLDFVCSLDWELKYHKIFTKYTDSLVDAIYEDDEHVENDDELQDFYVSLNTLFETIPDRYNAFKSKAGIKRFLSDTINHLVVGHEFYGTTGVSGATDPRVIMVSDMLQLPRRED